MKASVGVVDLYEKYKDKIEFLFILFTGGACGERVGN